MAKKNNITTEALKKLVGYIILAATNKSIIDDLNVAQDSVFSSYKLTQLLDLLKQENEEYANKLVGSLNKLSSEKTTVQPTLDNTTPNTLYLFSTSGSAPFEQFLRLTSELVSLGSTEINLDNMYTKEEADNKFATKQSLKDVTDKIGDTTQLETSTIMGDLEKAKESGGLIPVTKAQHNELVTNGSTTINGKVVTYDAEAFYVITDDENSVVDMSKYLTTADKVNMGIYAGDLNNVVVDKIDNVYVFGVSPSECTNLPINDYGMLEVMYITSNNFCIQRFTSITNEIYTRNKVSGNWNAWRKLYSTGIADVPSTVVTTTNANINTSSGYIRYRVKNGICYVSVYNIISSATGSQIISNSLPTPEDVVLYGGSVTGSANGINTGYMYVEKGVGKFVIEVNTANVAMFGTFSYPVAES